MRPRLHRRFGHGLLEDTAPTVQARHHRADRNVENLRSVRIREVADVHQHDDVAEVMRHLRKRTDDIVLRQPLDDPFLIARPVTRCLELVVEEVVAFLERLRVRRALLLAAAIDVQVRQDPQQPCPQVRAGRERAPAPKRARIRFLHQILGLLAGTDEVTGHPINLIRQCKRVLLEAHAVARFRCQLPRVGFPCRLAHAGPPYQGVPRINVRLSTHIPGRGGAR
jgi:hypothetical protein